MLPDWKLPLTVKFVGFEHRPAHGLVPDAGLTTTCSSSKEDSAPSLAVRRRTYVPDVENVAVVEAALAGENVTVPGPEVLDQVMVSAGGAGSPSSLTVPAMTSGAGKVSVLSGPAITTGAVSVAELTTTCTSSNDVSAPSLAVSRRTYVPAVENDAVVDAAFGGENVTVPGPEVLDQVMVSAGGVGSPSSLT